MESDNTLPVYELARLWNKTESSTLDACLAFRRKVPPGWNLSWFRDRAADIVDGTLKRPSLISAIEEHVPAESQKSVTQAVDLFLGFVTKHSWTGKSLRPKNLALPDGPKIVLRPTGRYFSERLEKEFLLALQPRSSDAPNPEQLRIWHSALLHEYCDGDAQLDVMIVDLSKNLINGKRELTELTSRKLKKLERAELNERLELVTSCYAQAVLIVPDKPRRHRAETSTQKKLL